MTLDTRLSGVLHVLIHLAQAKGPVPSEVLAKTIHTNPVVVRRLMAGLREQALVESEKGHGGGWSLTAAGAKATLRDVYVALGSPSLLAIGHRSQEPGCAVESVVHAVLGEPFREAEALLLARFEEVTLAELSAEVQEHLTRRGHSRRSGSCGEIGGNAPPSKPRIRFS